MVPSIWLEGDGRSGVLRVLSFAVVVHVGNESLVVVGFVVHLLEQQEYFLDFLIFQREICDFILFEKVGKCVFYRLFAAIGKLHSIGAPDCVAVGFFVLAEVCAGVFILDAIRKRVWLGWLLR